MLQLILIYLIVIDIPTLITLSFFFLTFRRLIRLSALYSFDILLIEISILLFRLFLVTVLILVLLNQFALINLIPTASLAVIRIAQIILPEILPLP